MNGIKLIANERRRQVETEGWTPEHDAQHIDGSMLMAAMYYAAPDCLRVRLSDHAEVVLEPEDFWPATWAKRWAKRDKKTRVRQLVTAGALIAAEIDRLQRDNPQDCHDCAHFDGEMCNHADGDIDAPTCQHFRAAEGQEE